MVNIERGFKRIAWVVSTLGLILFLVGTILAIVYSTKIAGVRGDPEFRALDAANQGYVLEKLRDEWLAKYPGFPLMLSGGAVFGLSWGIFFLLRCIVKGFLPSK